MDLSPTYPRTLPMTTALIPVGERLDVRTYADVAAAALLMVATLPGRTHGLGLITEPLLAELQLDRVEYATLNLWATLIGAAFCLPSGWILDRLGPRAVGAIVAFLLGVVVVATSFIDAALAAVTLFALITLTRGLGQSGLSVTSLALMGKSGAGRSGFASALYAAGVALGFAGATALVKYAGDHLCLGWHALWAGMGWVLILGIPPVVWLLASPGCAWKRESVDDFHPSAEGEPLEQLHGATLWEALRGPTFWVVATTTSAYGLVVSGLSLFQQSVLEERGFDRDVFLTSATLSPLAGLLGNLIGGALLRCVGVTRVLVVGATGVAIGLALFQSIVTPAQVYLYAGGMGAAGGLISVAFLGGWRHLYGVAHLGQIQGAAQTLTVLASAVGPLLLAGSHRALGSFTPLLQGLAVAIGLLALSAWIVRQQHYDSPT